ncbi:MAG: hypothetical protein V3T31_12010, partial [candidate division Zixibacteria bacterium]
TVQVEIDRVAIREEQLQKLHVNIFFCNAAWDIAPIPPYASIMITEFDQEKTVMANLPEVYNGE